jgi:hypothetical protein
VRGAGDLTTPCGARNWRRNAHEKPIVLLEAGEWKSVLGLIDALAEGVFV